MNLKHNLQILKTSVSGWSDDKATTMSAALAYYTVFSIARGFSFLDTALTIMVVQTILQGSYFMGLVIRAVFTPANHTRPIL